MVNSKGLATVGSIKRRVNRTFEGKISHEELLEYLSDQIIKRDERIELQSRALEIANRVALPIYGRKLELIRTDSSNSKLTINPCDGRVTLKISSKSSEQVVDGLIKFTKEIMKFDSFEPLTFRGKLDFHEGKYKITLITLSKRFRHYFEYVPNN